MGKMFVAFGGNQTPSQQEVRHRFAEGYELWKLDGLPFAEFIQQIQQAIPPVHQNVTTEKNYMKSIIGNVDMAPFYAKCKWGLLLPTPSEDRNWEYEEETLRLLNLYSPAFLYPYFFVNDLGIQDQTIPISSIALIPLLRNSVSLLNSYTVHSQRPFHSLS